MQCLWRCNWRCCFDCWWWIKAASWIESDIWKCCFGTSLASFALVSLLSSLVTSFVELHLSNAFRRGKNSISCCISKAYTLLVLALLCNFTTFINPYLLQILQIGIHYGGIFYEFVPWNASVSWEIAQWGKWHILGENETHTVSLHFQNITPFRYLASVLKPM